MTTLNEILMKHILLCRTEISLEDVDKYQISRTELKRAEFIMEIENNKYCYIRRGTNHE